jgi:hypothetical protein
MCAYDNLCPVLDPNLDFSCAETPLFVYYSRLTLAMLLEPRMRTGARQFGRIMAACFGDETEGPEYDIVSLESNVY